MRRVLAVFGSLLFLVLAPGIVAGLVPRWITRWRFEPFRLAYLPVQIVGGMLVAAGVLVLLDSFARFAIRGLGTPAPVFPTRHLIINGLYRYARNPMYLAVLSVIVGQGLLFENSGLFAYGALVWLAFHLFVVFYEEPTLRRQFGAEYEAYTVAVPRWLPRIRRRR